MSLFLFIAIVCGALWLLGTLVPSSNISVGAALKIGIVCLIIWAVWFGAGAHWRWRWWW